MPDKTSGNNIMNHTIKTQYKGQPFHIHIRLSDPFKNGHKDFDITADLWAKGTKSFSDKQLESCGCMHKEVLEVKPILKQFVDLHLCSEDGVPMHAVENGFYHTQGVRGDASYGHTFTIEKLAKYMRVSEEEAQQVVDTIHSKDAFRQWVDTIRPRWKKEADAAKAMLISMIESAHTTA